MKDHPNLFVGALITLVSISLVGCAFLVEGLPGVGLVLSLILMGACFAYLLTNYKLTESRIIDRTFFIDKSNRDYLAGLMAGLNTVRDIPNLVVDARGTVYGANEGILKFLDCTSESVVGQPVECISTELAEHVLNYFELCRVGNVRSPLAVQCTLRGNSCSLHMQAIENDRTGEKWVRLTVSQAAHNAAAGSETSIATLGRFSAGVAHDLNNLLSSIVGSVGILQRRFGDSVGEREMRLIGTIATAAKRGSRLAQDLMEFGKTTSNSLAGRNVQLNTILDEAVAVAQNTLDSSGCRVVKTVPANVWVLATDEGLHQIFVNLIFNAIDAMPDGGDILLSAGKEGNSVVWVDVVDSGTGMSEEVAKRAFEPFFSTKKKRDGEYLGGSGLGLANARVILDAWGGTISLTSREGVGSTLRVQLQAADVSVDELIVH